jgi:hypothetical protein
MFDRLYYYVITNGKTVAITSIAFVVTIFVASAAIIFKVSHDNKKYINVIRNIKGSDDISLYKNKEKFEERLKTSSNDVEQYYLLLNYIETSEFTVSDAPQIRQRILKLDIKNDLKANLFYKLSLVTIKQIKILDKDQTRQAIVLVQDCVNEISKLKTQNMQIFDDYIGFISLEVLSIEKITQDRDMTSQIALFKNLLNITSNNWGIEFTNIKNNIKFSSSELR